MVLGVMCRVIGDKSKVDFWAGDESLRHKFPWLFHLSSNRKTAISDMGKWVEGNWKWELRLRRELFERELDTLNDLFAILDRYKPKKDAYNSWVWRKSKKKIYTTKEGYQSIRENRSRAETQSRSKKEFVDVWKSIAPHKASTTAWRLLWNRLPTKSNLFKRLQGRFTEANCNLCGNTEEETTNHLFALCPNTSTVLQGVCEWLKIQGVMHREVKIHFESSGSLLNAISSKGVARGLWICVIWVIWRWRNKTVFEN